MVSYARREGDSWWQNVKAMYRRFVIDEVPDVRIRATVGAQSLETTTDAYGYFRLNMTPRDPVDSDGAWLSVELELLDQVCKDQGPVRAQGHMLVPTGRNRFGVISDVDDTIIHTYATDFLRMAWITFLKNAGYLPNPFFYVSSSAWNLYDVVKDFLDLHDIPAGPILMGDLRLDDNKLIKSGHEEKLGKIQGIRHTYSNLMFVLVGDAGRDDPALPQLEPIRERCRYSFIKNSLPAKQTF